jgi:uncharacterized protein
MRAVDTNILVYAHREDSPFHRAALTTLLRLANGSARWAIPWPCLHEFVAIVTHPRIYDPPSPPETALAAMRQWVESPLCETIGEGPGYFDRLCEVALAAHVAGPMMHDARIAAICLHNGVTELLSCDRDFSRFGRLKVVNPLLAP